MEDDVLRTRTFDEYCLALFRDFLEEETLPGSVTRKLVTYNGRYYKISIDGVYRNHAYEVKGIIDGDGKVSSTVIMFRENEPGSLCDAVSPQGRYQWLTELEEALHTLWEDFNPSR